jgi:hypothetical protein
MEFKDINQILSQLNQAATQSSLSPIEKQVVLNKLANLYEYFSGSEALSPIVPEVKHEAAPVETIKEIMETEIIETELKVKKDEVESVVIVSPVIDKATEVVKESKAEKNIELVKEDQKANSLLGKYENSDNSSLNQKFVGQGKGLNERVAVGDLKKLIDFNRQFVFTQELFANDPAAYTEAIAQLNHFEDAQSAFNFITSELVAKYKWNMSSETFKLFDAIIRKKFGV